MEEKKESKYLYENGKPVKVSLDHKQAVVLQKVTSTNKETKKVYENVKLTGGYDGTLGFKPHKFNQCVQLPANLSDEDLKAIFKAYQGVRDGDNAAA